MPICRTNARVRQAAFVQRLDASQHCANPFQRGEEEAQERVKVLAGTSVGRFFCAHMIKTCIGVQKEGAHLFVSSGHLLIHFIHVFLFGVSFLLSTKEHISLAYGQKNL